MSERKWLNCRLADLEEKLAEQGHGVSRPVISRLLHAHDYHLHVILYRITRAATVTTVKLLAQHSN